jgi:formylglycine-generating enzyme required for sulfatase activity
LTDERPPIRVFFSYSHEDDRHRIRLEKALKLLERQGLIDTWSDRKLLPGDRWEEGIEEELERADLILFLVSDDFIASEFIWGREMKRALEREEKGEARVVPVIVRPCDWHTAPFGKLQAVPKDGLAVTHSDWGSEDEAWADVARRLRTAVEELARKGAATQKSTGASAAPDPTRYLEALESRNSFVEIRGMGAQVVELVPLDQVYTTLEVIHTVNYRKKQRSFRLRFELSDVESLVPDAVLIGDPGSGKTTFLRFAALVLARSMLAKDPILPKRELGLDIGTPEEIPFPVFLRLTRFSEFLADHPDDSCPEDAPEHLLRYLDFELKGRNLGLPDDYLRRRVAFGGCFLLLDGLDEVPGALRARVSAIVDELVATVPTDSPNRHLITCRTRAYRGLVRLGGLPAFPLAPFRADQVARFVRGWSRALFQVRRRPGDDGAQEDAKHYEKELLEAIHSHENVGPMTESPLMLTMLAVVHWNQKKLPERRNELYEAAVTYLLESRKDNSTFPAPQRREALQALALTMFTDKEGVQRSLGLLEAGRAVTPLLQASESEARAFLDEEALQSGLLVSRTEGEVEFWHLSFQEYLAALELATGGDYWEVLSQGDRLHDDRWSEVVLLLSGCLRRLGGLRAATRLIQKILATGTNRVSQARAIGLVGRLLADVKPYGGDPSVGTEYLRVLQETLAIFEPPSEGEEVIEEAVREEVGEALGQAGDPRLADPEANWIRMPGGTFWMGAQNQDREAPGYDFDALHDESPVRRVTVSPFVLGRFPVTVQEFRRFVDAGDEGYLDPRLWDPTGWAWREQEGHTEPGFWSGQLGHPNRPVTVVSWYEADAYCRWVGERLPTEAEWELAARGKEGRCYPWGSQVPDDRRIKFLANLQPSPVGIYALGATPEGVHDLAGNVREWCGDWFGDYPPNDEKDPTGPPSGTSRVLRGYAFNGSGESLHAARRTGNPPEGRGGDAGFRVCRGSS